MELREPHERAGFAGWWPLFWPPSAPLRERYVVRLTVVGADSISAPTGRRGRRPLRINFMFAIKGKGPRRGQAPPYSTILYGAFRPRRGQSGEERKSVKKNAALLCFLAFLLLDHNFGVLRGERLAAKTMAASLLRKPARAVIRPAGANIARSPVSLRSTVAPCSQPRNPLGRDCAVAKQSKPQWGFEAHERARFAGWRRSLCAAKRAPRK